MALSPRLIRRRIRSVGNTKKITKAMELVAAAKMRRAVSACLRTRAYANLAWRMIESLEGMAGENLHPLLRNSQKELPYKIRGRGKDMLTENRRVLYVVMASDRGLCGGFNAALFREVIRDIQSIRRSEPRRDGRGEESRTMASAGHNARSLASFGMTKGDEKTKFAAIGKKTEQFIRRMGWSLTASFTNLSVAPTVAELRPIAKLAIDMFSNNEVDEVRLAFTDFISSLRQQPRVKILLPFQRIEEVGVGETYDSRLTTYDSCDFLFEPDPEYVLDQMLPRLTELQVYQAFLETGASEHSARMLAMRNASDAAREMIDDLTLNLNQARQSLITREIAEISAGTAALQINTSS